MLQISYSVVSVAPARMLDRIEGGTVTSWNCTRDFSRAAELPNVNKKAEKLTSCMLAIVLMFFFSLAEVINFPFLPDRISSQDIMHKSKFDFNKYISISEIIVVLNEVCAVDFPLHCLQYYETS